MQGKRIAPSDKGKDPWTDAQKEAARGNAEKKPIPQSAMEKEQARRTARRARQKKFAYRTAVAVLAVLLALLIAVAAWWKVFTQKPVLPDETENPGAVTDIDPPIRTSGDRKEDFFTFLVIGRDTGGGGNTDTILLASYDIPNQQMSVLSIPRDTMVNVPWEIKRINSVYNFYGSGDKGVEALGKEVAQLVGYTPDFQMVLEWKAVGELVDALGGVKFNVPVNMYYRDPKQNLTINVKKGEQILNGDLAMQVVRYRSYPNGDLGRIQVQQDFLKEVIRTCLKLENMTKVNALAKVFTDNVTTNLSINELAWLADKAIFGGLRADGVNFFTMPNNPASVWSNTYQNYQSYVVPIVDDVVELVNIYFNPYLDDLDTHELDIMSVSGGRITSSTGKLEDPNANSHHPPAKTDEEDAQEDEPGSTGERAEGQTTPDAGESGGQTQTPEEEPLPEPEPEPGVETPPPPEVGSPQESGVAPAQAAQPEPAQPRQESPAA